MPDVAPLAPRLRRDLEEVVGRDHLITDPEVTAGSTVDWTGRFRGATPALLRPGSVEEVAAIVRLCGSAGVALVPQGGNTGLVGGSVPLEGEVVVSTSRLVGVSEVDRSAGRLTAGAGTTIAAIHRAAAEAGWAYGVDWGARETATVGGSVATDAGGLHVVRHGSTRAQLLGVEAALGTGAVLDDLSRLEKDTTGYDLSALLCGSEGTLGVITRARLRLVPDLPSRALAALGLASWANAVAAAGRLRRQLPGLEAVEAYGAAEAALVAGHLGAAPALDPPPPVTLLVECAGHGDQVAVLHAAVADLDGVEGAAVAEDSARRAALWRHREGLTEAISTVGTPHKLDVSLPSEALADFVGAVPGRVARVAPGAATWLFGHLGDGNVHVNVTGARPDAGDIDDAVLGLVIDLGGSVSAEHGVGTAKRGWAARQRGASAMAAMAAIKAALDPAGVLNPHVLF